MQDNYPPSFPIVITCIDTCCAPVTCPVSGQQRDNFTMIPDYGVKSLTMEHLGLEIVNLFLR